MIILFHLVRLIFILRPIIVFHSISNIILTIILVVVISFFCIRLFSRNCFGGDYGGISFITVNFLLLTIKI